MMQMIKDGFLIKVFRSEANWLNVILAQVHFSREFHEGDVVLVVLALVVRMRHDQIHSEEFFKVLVDAAVVFADFDDRLRFQVVHEIRQIPDIDVVELALNVDAMSGRDDPFVRNECRSAVSFKMRVPKLDLPRPVSSLRFRAADDS